MGPLRHYDPYGQPLEADGTVQPDAVPDNQPGDMDYGWLGQHQRSYEHAGSLALFQMGARPYSPVLGRFLSVDPNPHGAANDYDYVGANPVNTLDLDGSCWVICDIVDGVKKGVQKAASWVADNADYLTAGLAVGCVILSAGVCAGAGLVLWGTTTLAQGLSPRHSIDWTAAAVNLAAIGGGAAAARYAAGAGALKVRGAPKTVVRRKEHTTRYTKTKYKKLDWDAMGPGMRANALMGGAFGTWAFAVVCAIKKKAKFCWT